MTSRRNRKSTKFLFSKNQLVSTSMVNRIVLVDFYTWFFKSTLSKNIQQLNQYNEDQIVTGQLFSLYRSYRKLLEQELIEKTKYFKNSTLFFVFDRRHSKLLRKREIQFKEYKANRTAIYQTARKTNLFKSQQLFLNSLLYFGFYNEYFEADDVISYIVEKYRELEKQNLLKDRLVIDIITLDSDLIQILNKEDLTIVSYQYEFRKFLYSPKHYKDKKLLVRYINLKDDYKVFTLEDLKDKFNNLENPKLVYWFKVYLGDTSDNIPHSFQKNKKLSSKKLLVELLQQYEYQFLEIHQNIKNLLSNLTNKSEMLNTIIDFILQNKEIKELLIEKVEKKMKRKIELQQFIKNIVLILLKDYEIQRITFSSNIEDYISGTLRENYNLNKTKYNFKKVPDFELDYIPLFDLLTKNLKSQISKNIFNLDYLNGYSIFNFEIFFKNSLNISRQQNSSNTVDIFNDTNVIDNTKLNNNTTNKVNSNTILDTLF